MTKRIDASLVHLCIKLHPVVVMEGAHLILPLGLLEAKREQIPGVFGISWLVAIMEGEVGAASTISVVQLQWRGRTCAESVFKMEIVACLVCQGCCNSAACQAPPLLL